MKKQKKESVSQADNPGLGRCQEKGMHFLKWGKLFRKQPGDCESRKKAEYRLDNGLPDIGGKANGSG